MTILKLNVLFYLQGEIVLRGELETLVAKHCKQILEYQARAACQFNRNTALQIVRNIVEVDSWACLHNRLEKCAKGIVAGTAPSVVKCMYEPDSAHVIPRPRY
jgi:hypothetical protein